MRFHLTNTANTRVFNVAFRGARMKRVGGDSGRVEREEFVESVVIAPSERVVIDVLFDEPGQVTLEHRTPNRIYRLGAIDVLDQPAEPPLADAFEQLRTNDDMAIARDRVRSALATEPVKTLAFVAEMNLDAPFAATGGATVYTCPMHPAGRGQRRARATSV